MDRNRYTATEIEWKKVNCEPLKIGITKDAHQAYKT